MTIEISKQEIFNEVEKRTSLEGSMIPERFDRVWASTYEGELLESYWIEGYTAVIQMLKRYLSSASVNFTLTTFNKDEKLTIEATMPTRYNTLFDGSVATDVKMLIACNIVASWLDIKLPEAAKKYSEEAKDYAEDLQKKVLYRKEPTNTVVVAESDTMDVGRDEVAISAADVDEVKIKETEDAIKAAELDETKIKLEEVALSAAESDTEDLSKDEEALSAAESDSESVNRTEADIDAADADEEKIKAEEAALVSDSGDSESTKKAEESIAAADVDGETISKTEASLRRARCDYEFIDSVVEEVMSPAKNDTEPFVQNHCGCEPNRYIRNCCDGYCNW